MKLTIDINDEQVRFLKQFAEKQAEGSRDNVCTRKPLHLVQTERIEYVHDGGDNGDYNVFINADDVELPIFENERDLVLKYGEYDDPDDVMDFETAYACDSVNDMIITDYNDYFEAYGITSPIERLSAVRRYETVAYFFILENAKAYMSYQSHHLKNPRTYTVTCGYSNKGEYESFFDLLMSIGQQLNSNDLPTTKD